MARRIKKYNQAPTPLEEAGRPTPWGFRALTGGELLLVLWTILTVSTVVHSVMRMQIQIKTPDELQKMRVAGRMAAEVLEAVAPYVVAGATTDELDDIIHNHIVNVQGAYPAPLNYGGFFSYVDFGKTACKAAHHFMAYILSAAASLTSHGLFFGLPVCGFPKSACISVNNEVCHGVPGARVLADGDIVNIDVTVIYDGYHGDTNMMYIVGDATAEAQRLVDAARDCMFAGVAEVRDGAVLGAVGAAVEACAAARNYSVVQEYYGHGIGTAFHEGPMVPHYSASGSSTVLRAGMALTVEPMLNAGARHVTVRPDQWTVETRDGSLSAQWEHTLVVLDEGCEILTGRAGETWPEGVERPTRLVWQRTRE